MASPLSRRDVLKVLGVQALAAVPAAAGASPFRPRALLGNQPGWVSGRMTGAQALVETLQAEGTECVYGIPGAQMNELWDTFKAKHLPYLLVTHEYSAAGMADGYARSRGKPGVLCVVPGPGLTNALTGIGEALLDSVPMVCIVGDVAQGERWRPFQVHALHQAALLRPVTKAVVELCHVSEIPMALRQAFRLARGGEPGPVGVVVPYPLLLEAHRFLSGPLEPLPSPWDEDAFRRALQLLSQRRCQVGIYAGMGCMDYAPSLVRVAEMLQAPVATSICGKGVIPENHPLAVGWGFGPQGTRTAEEAFRSVDVVLAIGVRFSEVSTGFYSIPQPRSMVHVDINPDNLGRVLRANVCVNADAGVFLERLLGEADCLARPPCERLLGQIRRNKADEARDHARLYARCGADPMAFILALRRCSDPQALLFVDVTCSQYWASEVFTTFGPRTFFNPTNNQSMGWSIPAAVGAQMVNHGRQVMTLTGDGCFLMSAVEISTAAREGLPVKFFVLDDQAYHYMQLLQLPAYLRTTATVLARLDYRAFAQAMGVAYQEILCTADIEAGIRGALCHDGPVLTRVAVDYRRRPIRWIDAARRRFTNELTVDQQVRFATRIGTRSLHLRQEND
jgi:acetolactate synthase I/II/III large subunit